ncbi:TonB-dependent receptor domain-containing protein [Massilia sp. IC2-476]|uniref:TonB-dependent receptor domain-containing protein n=1 Tax=Massilia sp. IC2-476 TaxID=2887199 RepID=UPI001D1277B7|nr:TonB-dependent receptor [Massilia sp. IC2-476]MCC2975023.1 TonB-dependent receptor [Massilia sp. IC2-476]
MNFPVTRQAAARSLASALALAFASPSFAQTLDSVVVTANRMPQRAVDVIADTTVIHADEIARSGAGSVADVLRRQRGIEITRNGSAGASTSVFLRGANSNQVVVLLDGVRIGSSTSGVASWNAVPLGAIERIEVVYGPLSTLYGADAIGGVIQIFTRKGDGSPTVSAAVGAGSNATRKADASLHGAGDALRYAFSAGYEDSDGFSATRPGAFGFNPDEDGYRRRNANGQLSYTLAPGHEIGAQFLHSDLRAQYDSGAGPYDVNNKQDLNTAAVYVASQFTSNWRSTLQFARSDDKLGSFTSAAASGASQIDTQQDELTWQNTIALGPDTLQLLYSHRKEEVESSSTADLSRSRTTNSYAAAYSAKRGSHLFDASARHDRSVYGNKNTGAAGYGYNFGRGLRATASVGSSFRAPTFNELYYPGYGLPTNRPEKGRNLEAGLRYDAGKLQFDATWFRNRLTDMIVSATPCPGRAGSCAYNVNEAKLEGVTLAAEALVAGVTLRGSLDWQDPTDETTGKQLARRAKKHASFMADSSWGALKAGAELQLSGERFDDAANRNRLGGYGLLNLYATWQFTPDVSLLLRVDNVADKRYELARNYGTSGRTWFAGLRYGIR